MSYDPTIVLDDFIFVDYTGLKEEFEKYSQENDTKSFLEIALRNSYADFNGFEFSQFNVPFNPAKPFEDEARDKLHESAFDAFIDATGFTHKEYLRSIDISSNAIKAEYFRLTFKIQFTTHDQFLLFQALSERFKNDLLEFDINIKDLNEPIDEISKRFKTKFDSLVEGLCHDARCFAIL